MRNTSTKLLLAVSGALAVGTAGLAVAHETGCVDKTQASQAQLQGQPGSSAGSNTAAASTAANWNSPDRDQATSKGADRMAASTTQLNNSGQGADVVWFVMPVALQTQGDRMSNGCWVKLYSGENYDGRYMTIVGPTEVAELRSPYGTGMNNWESAVVGPNATVVTYDDDNFQSRDATLRANQRYPRLDDSQLGLFQDIESVKVKCSGQSRSGAQATTSQ